MRRITLLEFWLNETYGIVIFNILTNDFDKAGLVIFYDPLNKILYIKLLWFSKRIYFKK